MILNGARERKGKWKRGVQGRRRSADVTTPATGPATAGKISASPRSRRARAVC